LGERVRGFGDSPLKVRDLILKGKPWEHLVPPVVALYIKKWNIKDRLMEIKEKNDKK